MCFTWYHVYRSNPFSSIFIHAKSGLKISRRGSCCNGARGVDLKHYQFSHSTAFNLILMHIQRMLFLFPYFFFSLSIQHTWGFPFFCMYSCCAYTCSADDNDLHVSSEQQFSWFAFSIAARVQSIFFLRNTGNPCQWNFHVFLRTFGFVIRATFIRAIPFELFISCLFWSKLQAKTWVEWLVIIEKLLAWNLCARQLCDSIRLKLTISRNVIKIHSFEVRLWYIFRFACVNLFERKKTRFSRLTLKKRWKMENISITMRTGRHA